MSSLDPKSTLLGTSETVKKVFVEPELNEFDDLEKQIQGLRVLESFTGSILAP
jgi:hypothetical protein